MESAEEKSKRRIKEKEEWAKRWEKEQAAKKKGKFFAKNYLSRIKARIERDSEFLDKFEEISLADHSDREKWVSDKYATL